MKAKLLAERGFTHLACVLCGAPSEPAFSIQAHDSVGIRAGNVAVQNGDRICLISTLPIAPQPLGPHKGVGIAFNGIKSNAPVPKQTMPMARTIAPDVCERQLTPTAADHYRAPTI
jgi:hypothetical protein